MRVHVTCAVSQGDPPLTFKWCKDGTPITDLLSLDIISRQYDTYTSSLSIDSVSSIHTGNYSCSVTNRVATVNHMAQLLVHVSPKIIPFSFQDKFVSEGTQARVLCGIVEGDGPMTFSWLKDGRPIARKDVIIRVVDNFSSILSIANVRSIHTGNYSCVVKNDAASSQFTADLIVNVPPKIVPFTIQDENLLEGLLVRMSCVVSRGDLPLSITWLKDDRPIPTNLSVTIREFDEYSSVLSIDPVSDNHNGNYTCKAKNEAGFDTFVTSIIIKERPKWVIRPNDTKVLIGNSAMIPCDTTGYPKPNTTWYKVEGLESSGTKKQLFLSNSYQLFPNGSLYIKSMNLSHAGYYFCLSENSIGSISKAILVSVTSVPPQLVKTISNQTVRQGESVIFRCVVTGDQPINFTWLVRDQKLPIEIKSRFIVHQKDESGQTISQLEINNVERSDSTNFICIAENSYGAKNATFHLQVLETPDAPDNVKIVESSNRTSVIGWQAPFNGNSPITKYVVQFKLSSDKWESGVRNLTLPGYKLQSAITGLKPSTKYQARVIAENKIGLGKPSKSVDIAMAEEAPNGPPTEVTAIATDSHSLKISWKPPRREFWNGIIRGYYVGYRPVGSHDTYNFRLLEVPENYTDILSLSVTDLHKFTQYSIVVQAFNDGGKGPFSKEIVSITSESVPTKPPQDVKCSVLSSQSIHLTWNGPPPQSIHGVLQGYKIFYRPVNDWADATKPEVKAVGISTKVTLQQLQKFTNYSVHLLASTRRGDGVKSEPIFCRTMEDVPEPPSDVKALSAFSQSILVAWKPPVQPNGVIIKYTIYYKQSGISKELQNERKHSVRGNLTYHKVINLKSDETYQFWITASTFVGESGKSRSVSQSPSNILTVPKIAGFDSKVLTSRGNDVVLPCVAAGSPTPVIAWRSNGPPLQLNHRHLQLDDHSLLIKDTDEFDNANFTCSAQNDHGMDQITYTLTVQSVPGIPFVEISLITTTTIDVQWKITSTGSTSILGYKLYYKHDHNDWETIELDAGAETYQMDGLHCGTRYQIYMVAENKLGQGKTSPVLTTSTKGGVPVSPSKSSLIEKKSTSATLNLDSWLVDKCAIKYFVVEYKPQKVSQWKLFADDIKPEKRKLVISNLTPATWYNLRMIAHSRAGTSASEYTFATLTVDGATIAPETMSDEAEIQPVAFKFELKHVVAAASSLLIIILLGVIVCICAQNSKSKKYRRTKSGRKHGIAQSESGSDSTYTSSYGYSVGRSTVSRDPRKNFRKCELAPYATGHLTDHYQPEELAEFNLRHSMVGHGNTLPGVTVPFYPQSRSRQRTEGLGNGNFPSTVDVINLHNHLQQMATAPPMSDSYGGHAAGYPQGSNITATPLRKTHVRSSSTSLPPPIATEQRNGSLESTFIFPAPSKVTSGSEQTETGTIKYDAPWDVKGQVNKF